MDSENIQSKSSSQADLPLDALDMNMGLPVKSFVRRYILYSLYKCCIHNAKTD